MTRKHFKAITEAIRIEKTAVAVREDVRRQVARNIASVLKNANPNFVASLPQQQQPPQTSQASRKWATLAAGHSIGIAMTVTASA